MSDIEKLKEQILKDYPRLKKDSTFTFRCHPGVPCFNACCADINIFLTPYDVVRLRKNLNLTSGEFLSKYTISPFDKNLPYPAILLQMRDDEKKQCPFVEDKGCSVYPDRPWACRIYPVGMASPGEEATGVGEEFYFLLEEKICQGFGEDKKWTIAEWLDDQGVSEYNKAGEDFKELTTHKFFIDGGKLPPEKVDMFFMACYDVDRFRKFVFESSFLERFEIDPETVAAVKDDDLELLKLGCRWLRFALFNEETLVVKDQVREQKTQELRAAGKLPKEPKSGR